MRGGKSPVYLQSVGASTVIYQKGGSGCEKTGPQLVPSQERMVGGPKGLGNPWTPRRGGY